MRITVKMRRSLVDIIYFIIGFGERYIRYILNYHVLIRDGERSAL